MALEKELQVYKNQVANWTDHRGKFVLIQGENVLDFFATYDDAIKSGYQQFGLEPFLVKQVLSSEHVQCITRLFTPSVVH